jgi:hypothetical protein
LMASICFLNTCAHAHMKSVSSKWHVENLITKTTTTQWDHDGVGSTAST